MTMNWKNVLRLYGVYTKSYRLILKDKWRNYKESWRKKFIEYTLLLLLGIALGSLIAWGLGTLMAGSMPDRQQSIRDAAAGIFVALPVINVLFSLYITQMNQIQRMSTNTAIQPIYWFPLTWEEHTLASILSTMQVPLALGFIFVPALLIPAFTIDLLPLGMLTVAALAASTIITGATSEVLKGVQIRIVEAVSKRAGRLTVWLRFGATLVIFTLVYIFYFTIFRADTFSMIQSLSDGIMLAWFIPYLWPGIVLYEAYHGAWLEAALFTAGIAGFSWLLFRIAVHSSHRYALMESRVVRISGGAYAPGRGLLQRLGISPEVAAIMRKDLRAYTRRQELMYIFVMPIVFMVSTLMPVLAGGRSDGPDVFSFFSLALEPPVVLAIFLASSIVGSEGGQRWFLIMSPLSARSFVRAKYLLSVLVGSAVALASVAVASLLFQARPWWIATGVIESLLLTVSTGMVALCFGIKGADFRESARQQTIRGRWMLSCMLTCTVLGLIIVLPVLAYGAANALGDIAPGLLPSPLPHAYLIAAWAASGILALAIGYVFYLYAVRAAGDLFKSMDT